MLKKIVEANLRRRGAEIRREAGVMLAGAFNALVRWWVRNGFNPAPEDMQAWFDRFAEAATVPSPSRASRRSGSVS